MRLHLLHWYCLDYYYRQGRRRQKIELISNRLRVNRGATFRNLLGENPTRLEIVVTFLALLELVKRYRVQAQQETLFSDIDIQPMEEFKEGEEFDLEFE